MTEIITHKFHDTIIREYDIRGIYDETLHNIDAKILRKSFGMEVGMVKRSMWDLTEDFHQKV